MSQYLIKTGKSVTHPRLSPISVTAYCVSLAVRLVLTVVLIQTDLFHY